MAQKRMFSIQITDTDKFLDMSTSAQALYFHLGMHGDDDGFVASPRKIARAAGCNDDDLRLLAAKGYIIPFDSGVVVISDWGVNNTLKNDRYRATIYTDEKSTLTKSSSGRWELGTSLEPSWNQSGSSLEPKHNITKPNLIEQSKTESMVPPAAEPAPASKTPDKEPKKKFGQYGWIRLTETEYSRLLADLGQAELDRCVRYVDESAQGNGNKNKWKDWNLVIRRCHRDGWGLSNRKENSKGRTANDSAAEAAARWNLPGIYL